MVKTELPVPELAVRLFGGAAIEQAGVPLADRAAHRHALALLALLATARGRLLTRDKVIAVLWPEGDTDTVRHRLSVVIYELRRILGRTAIVSINDSLRLDADVVWIDVVRFEAALQRGAADEAYSLYRGDFLDGFHLPDAQEFDEWIAGHRSRLAGALHRGLEVEAVEASKGGDPESAIRSWRRLVQLDPLGVRATMGLMRSLSASGDLHGAEQVAAAHAIRREAQLGAGADKAIEGLLEELRAANASRPQRFAPATPSALDPVLLPAADAQTRQAGSAGPAAHPRRWLRRLLPAAATASLVLLVLWSPARDDRAVAVGSERPRDGDVVILPFAVHGGGRHAYLADGMAELLSITLDGAGPFLTADPHAVIAFAKGAGVRGVGPEGGARVASRFGASHFVLGTVVETGERLDLRVTLYEATGRLRASAVGSVAEGGDLVPVVDSLTRQLIASLYPSSVERLTRLAVATSASLPALKAYLEGEALVRTGDHAASVDAYRLATMTDSTFALAWYRLAVALENTLQPRAARDAGAIAVRHAARLPERDRMLLEGWHTYATGRADEAEAVYRRILDRYPNELDAWLQVGEIGFHHAASRGQTIAVARPAFERVLILDPDHEAAHVHLARIAGQAGDIGALTQHADYLIAGRAGTGIALEMATLKAFATSDRMAIVELRRRFVNEDSYTVLGMLMNAFHAGDMAAMEWCADLLQEPARPKEVRTAGHIVRALLDLSRGDRGAALASVAKAESLDTARGIEARALIVTAPFFDSDSSESASVRALLSALPRAVPESFFLPDPDAARPLMRRYLLGLLNAQSGDVRAAFRLAGELERAASPASDSALGADLAAGVRAEVARLRGDEGAALMLLDRISNRPTYQLVLPSPFEPRVRERYVRALLLDRAGRSEESRALFALLGARSLYDLPYARVKP